jgi:glycosyltransferase involved in cell wall biosynthesis
LYAAKKALEIDPNIKFIVAGSGDMEKFMIEKAAEFGIADKVLFTGFLRGKDIDKVYQMADLYIMPSVSEPFGITPLEAMRNNTPVIISKQSGVSEVISHCLKVDFWDIDQIVNKMLGVLRYKELSDTLKHHGSLEVRKFDWNIPAKKCMEVYRKVMGES